MVEPGDIVDDTQIDLRINKVAIVVATHDVRSDHWVLDQGPTNPNKIGPDDVTVADYVGENTDNRPLPDDSPVVEIAIVDGLRVDWLREKADSAADLRELLGEEIYAYPAARVQQTFAGETVLEDPYCRCDDPTVGRTRAKGTPAESSECADCGGRIRG